MFGHCQGPIRYLPSPHYSNGAPPVINSPLFLHRISSTPVPNHKYSHALNTVLNAETGQLQEYRHLIKGLDTKRWKEANCC